MDIDEKFMRLALNQARKGLGFTNPNPMVGAVIVRNGRVIGRGYHTRCGAPHAEIEAIRSLKRPSLARGAVIYVTLEPCSTFGRTPPCCDAIIECGFSRVVIGSTDPNPAHAGRAVKLLESHGMEVKTGVLSGECEALNEAFFKWITSKRPYVILKMAQTLDGKTATVNGVSRWITSSEARKRVMRLRLLSDAVLCGSATYSLDSPQMTARDVSGNVIKTPRRFVATAHPERLDLRPGWEFVSLRDKSEWDEFLLRLGREDVISLLIEGGGVLASSALFAGVVDYLEFHIAPKILGGLHSRPSVAGEDSLTMDNAISIEDMKISACGCDFIASGRPRLRKDF